MVDFKVDQAKIAALENFVSGVESAVNRGVEDAIEKMAKKGRKLFRRRLDRDDVPGPGLTKGWLAKKKRMGFYLTRHQRFGRGDPRSYYENIKVKKMLGGKAWFVGMVEGTKAYGDRGQIRDRDFTDIAVRYLERRWPIWHAIRFDLWKSSPKLIVGHIVNQLLKLSPGLDINVNA